MNDYTREDILQLVEEEDVAFIRLQFTDIFGTMKNMAVTVSQLEKRWITGACLTLLRLKAYRERWIRICISTRT